MRLTRYTDYGLRVLMLLSIRPKDVIPTEEIAQTFGISRDHLHKIVQDLSRRGWVESRRGPAGGVAFVESSRELTIGEVVRALENQFDLVECFEERTNECPITQACRLAPILDEARDSFLEVLDRHTLAEITRRPAKLRALLPVEPRGQGAARPAPKEQRAPARTKQRRPSRARQTS